jgi:ribosomal protein S18 acetylase RimI-like enzyme
MNRPAPRVRAAGVADLARIVEIDAAAFPTLPYPEFFLRQAIDALGGLVRVVEPPAGGVAGYALAMLAAGERVGWLLSMAVDPPFRGAGLARALVEDVVRELGARGAGEVLLTVEPDNAPARRLYDRLGFSPIRDEGDYFGDGAVRLLMGRAMGGGR